MRLKKLLRLLDGSQQVVGKLGDLAIKAYALIQLVHTLYKIAAHS